MIPGICCVPVSPMRAEPSHRSEMVSQQLFGEQCVVSEKGKDNWIKICCNYDQYEGWCQEGQVLMLDAPIESSVMLTGEWENEIGFNGVPMRIPFGCQLPGLLDGKVNWAGQLITFGGTLINPASMNFEEEKIREIGFPFVNTGYLWGGKSIFGIDCSGFCQTVYKFFNKPILRDASQQATQGEIVGFLQEARCGDLAFFDNAEGRITHVGIMLNEGEILHSSVKVRIDPIDNMGIINRDTGERTHKLRIIKRYF
ncbi:MAG: hydrolase [Chitinophagaceae bacterium]|nr:MAG: hydrolase [Chitinophagaceae bacterium]